MKFLSATRFRLIASLVAAVFALVSLGSLLCLGLNMGTGMSLADCPLMGAEAAMCPMQILNHIGAWQNLFTAIPASSFSLLLLVIALGMIGSRITLFSEADTPTLSIYLKNFSATHTAARLYNFWLRILARGIIQPKLFA